VDLSIKTQDTTKSFSAEKTFLAAIGVAAGEQKVDAIDAFLSFDPECLEVIRVTPGKALGVVLANTYDNAKGTIDLSMGREMKAEPASGTFVLGTIEFKAKKEVKETTIVFEQKLPRKTEVAYHGEPILGSATGLDLAILP
jgi:hypothetical protein